jgi:hypothetical protein
MLERDEKESGEVEVRPEEKANGIGERVQRSGLFPELGTGITTREVKVPESSASQAVATTNAGVFSGCSLMPARSGGLE